MARPSQRNKIYAYVCDFYSANGYSPSMSDIAAHLGLSSRSNIYAQLQQLVGEGLLVNLGGRYEPPDKTASRYEAASARMVPLLGTVAAGSPILAVENLEGYVGYLPRYGDGGELFALRLKGESMVEAGILDGDIVVVKKTPVASNGDIVVALVGDEATVKVFYRENGHIRLQPRNRKMEPIIVPDAVILGTVAASMRYFG